MTIADAVKLWPQIQAAFADGGVPITLSQALTIYPAVAALVKGDTPAPAPTVPSIPTTLVVPPDAGLAPYNVCLIGWTPDDHNGANLRDPANAKYIVYAYLVANTIQPTKTWATEAVPVLAAAVPSVPWTALDTETLGYGDEFVHTAPRGHGDPGLTDRTDLNPLEFFWGSFGA